MLIYVFMQRLRLVCALCVCPPPACRGLFATIQPTLEYGRNVLAVCTLSTIFVSMLSTPQIAFVFSTKKAFIKHRQAMPAGHPTVRYLVVLMLVARCNPSNYSLFWHCVAGTTAWCTPAA